MLKRMLSRLRGAGGRADRDARVDALYAQASAAWAAEDFDTALRHLDAARAIDNNLPALPYMAGMIALKRQQYPAAIRAFEACLAAHPGHPLRLNAQVQVALARAGIDLSAGKVPPRAPAWRGAPRLLSVIICSIDPQRYAAVCANLRAHLAEVPHEIIGVHDARSMYDGWQKGLSQARGELLLFCHDDIAVHAPDFADRLLERLDRFELIGPVGSMGLHGEGWLYSRADMRGQVGMAGAHGLTATVFGMQGDATPGPVVLDGMFLACTRALVGELGLDAATFNGWHLYDFDFSHRAWLAGKKTAVCPDLLVTHASTGGFDAEWRRYATRFAQKHPAARVHFGEDQAPQLVTAGLDSVAHWQWFTHHLCNGPGAAG